MRHLLASLIALCTLALTGCGSLLSSINVGAIEDHPAERTMARIIEDDNIETKTIVNLHAENEAYRETHLVIVCYNGIVLLAGQVADEALKAGATDALRKIKGVRRIANELEIGPPTSAMARTNDTWITTKIKSSLLRHAEVPSGQVKVVTENGVAYLMGLVTQKEADEITNLAATVSGVKRVVRLFELLD